MDINSLIEKGTILASRGQYEEAILYFNKVLEIKSDHTAALLNKGMVLVASGKPSEAISCYDKILDSDPRNLRSLQDKASALLFLKNIPEALNCIDEAEKIDPKNLITLSDKALVLGKLGKFEKAIEYFDKALEINSNHIDSIINKGVILVQLGKYEDAISCYDKVLKIQSKNVTAIYNKSLANARLGRIDESLSCLHEAIQLDPQYKIEAKRSSVFKNMKTNKRFIYLKLKQVLLSEQETKSNILENKKCQLLLQEPEIRFAGMIDAMGNLVSGGIKEGLPPFEDEINRKKRYMELVLRVSTRKEFDVDFGSVEYSASRRKKIIVLSFPLRNKILLVSAEPDSDIEKTASKVKKIFEI